MLSGKPGRLSMKVSIPPLFRPATWTLTQTETNVSKTQTNTAIGQITSLCACGPACRGRSAHTVCVSVCMCLSVCLFVCVSPAYPGHGGLCHQHRLLVRQQLDAVRESQVLHDDGQLPGFRVKLQNSEKQQQQVSETQRHNLLYREGQNLLYRNRACSAGTEPARQEQNLLYTEGQNLLHRNRTCSAGTEPAIQRQHLLNSDSHAVRHLP